jgi:hypothetical protein
LDSNTFEFVMISNGEFAIRIAFVHSEILQVLLKSLDPLMGTCPNFLKDSSLSECYISTSSIQPSLTS